MVSLDRKDIIRLPRASVRLPMELREPEPFEPARPETWPRVDGRLEYVRGKLLYMPPCGDIQQDVAATIVALLYNWARHGDFIVAGNEAGMLLGEDVRGADAAVWRRRDAAPRSGGFRRTPPVLAVEIAGRDEDEAALREKAAWYLAAGVELVWLVLPDQRQLVELTEGSQLRLSMDDEVTGRNSLPGLSLRVADLFEQLG